MNRRALLAISARAGVGSMASHLLAPLSFTGDLDTAVHRSNMRAVARPSADQISWQDLELGMFIHFGPETWQNGGPENIATPLSEINPTQLDTDQWARTAVDLGAKYIVFVAKHRFGFCWWQTDTTDYSVKNISWKNGRGDVLRSISESCRKSGLKLGVYLSPRDDHFGAATGGICKTPENQATYNALYRQQMKEVLSRYGSLIEIWFDGSVATPVGDLIRTYQPHAMVFQGPQATIRWVGNEDGFAPHPCWNGIDKTNAATGTATALDSDPNGSVWLPNEVDVSIRRPDWFWNPDNADKVLSEDQLLSIYYRSVGRGAQLLMNIPADTEGMLPEKDAAVAKRFGAEIRRRFEKPAGETSGQGMTLTLTLAKPVRIDTVVLQEDTSKGERVRGYTLEGRFHGAWKNLVEGSAIGHKRIQPVAPITIDAMRLVITKAAAPPAIRSLAVFDTGVLPPADWDAATPMCGPDLVGKWHEHHFSIDITKQIHAASQYRLHFVPGEGRVTGLKDVVLKLHGISQPRLVKRVPGKPDELVLDITGLAESSGEISGTVDGASSGQILLQKI